MALAASEEAQSTNHWLSVVGWTLKPESQERLTELAYAPNGITDMGLATLADRMSHKAFGIPLTPVAVLAAQVINSWFPFTAWQATRGLTTVDTPVHLLLPAVYGWLCRNIQEQKDLDKLNRRIFGKSKPW